jgi:hypothetical protein
VKPHALIEHCATALGGAGHAWPHAPQLDTLVVASTHAPEQSV